VGTPHTWQGVVLVDMQVDFFHDPELERCREDLVACCNRVVDAALDRGLPVVEVRTIHAADRSTWSLNMLEDDDGMVIAGTPGAEPVEGLHHAGTCGRIDRLEKTRDSAFHGTGLSDLLTRRHVRSFLLCGVSTESCIAATATDGYAHDFQVGIVLDATASVRWDLHDHTIDSLRKQYRQPAMYAEEAIAALAPGPAQSG
jgi:nicotinamidase-related amidase